MVASENEFFMLFRRLNLAIENFLKLFKSVEDQYIHASQEMTFTYGIVSLVPNIPSHAKKNFIDLMKSSELLKELKNLRLMHLKKRELEDPPFRLHFKIDTLLRKLGWMS